MMQVRFSERAICCITKMAEEEGAIHGRAMPVPMSGSGKTLMYEHI
jgi:hypothetical protein